MDYINRIIHGDCLKVLKRIPDNTFDSMVTDPPYQLISIQKRFGKKGSAPAKPGKDGSFQRLSKGFMGSSWDVLPSLEIWKECLRVLKPGAFAFVMCTPRQDSLMDMMLRLREAGFIMGFTSLYWTYNTGWTKGINIAKAIDKRMGIDTRPKNVEVMEKTSPVGKKMRDNLRCTSCGKPLISGNPCQCDRSYDPITEEAKGFEDAWGGYQPKIAVEVIIVCMKPLSENGYVDQVMKDGKGVTWLGDCRIPVDPDVEVELTDRGAREAQTWSDFKNETNRVASVRPIGRMPSNLLVSDDVFHDIQDEGTPPHPVKSNVEGYKGWGNITDKNGESVNYGDAGSMSRYYSLDAWAFKHAPFLVVSKPDTWERNMGISKKKPKNPRPIGVLFNENQPDGFKDSIRDLNEHPTIKPLLLASYLVHLGSRPGGLVLDPFLGSGTTAIAAFLFKRRFTGIEISIEYCRVAQKRLTYAMKYPQHGRFEDIREEVDPRPKTKDLKEFA